jgi:ABC-type Mn2+/Zn2+ transport system ATPase subunit
MNSVITTSYEMINRKLFSLPKVLLLPAVMSRQPWLIAQVFPFIFVSDWLKANVVAYMTTQMERLQKELQDLRIMRTRVESYDLKHAELLQRSGTAAAQFTQRRWEELTVRIQQRVMWSELIGRSKGFFAFIQRNFVFTVLIDCALANLIALGKIVAAEIFVFSRAIEDAVDLILTRSRGEAELARMATEIKKLEELVQLYERSKTPAFLRCNLAPPDHKQVILRNLHYTRGTASARADHVELKPGVIYALTGSNGSGKSTLFRILMSCDTNQKPIELPTSINLLTPMEPIIEEDDWIRETCCELSEDHVVPTMPNPQECEISENNTEECQASWADARDLAANEAVPRISITMPSSDVVEISQNFYWPLYSRPIDWIYRDHGVDAYDSAEVERRTRLIATHLHALQFFQSVRLNQNETATNTSIISDNDTNEWTIQRIMQELQEEKEDWFSDLSGGQKSKVELVRKVFRHERCPDLLLIDETMAPLDPASKSRVMQQLKSFCRDSIIVVIYHTDVGAGASHGSNNDKNNSTLSSSSGRNVECVPSNDFFDSNIHLDHGIVHIRDTC